MAPARQLVVVSNRGPYRQESARGRQRWVRAAGGLVAALDPVLISQGGVWISAKQAKDFDTVKLERPDVGYELATVSLARSEQKGFYDGVSNAVLWPLLHSMATTVRLSEAPWSSYVSANRAFADVTLASSKPRSLIWVQDYHLMLVPAMLREKRSKARVGWFCHVPWPPPDIFGILPWREDVLEGLLGADLLGFHTDDFVVQFLECVERFTDYEVDYKKQIVWCGDRPVRAMTAPIGIAVRDREALASDPGVLAEVDRIRQGIGHRRIILGVDRLDYTKGIPERLSAFEKFLRTDRLARERYVFVQVMVPSRTDVRAYAELKSEIDRMVGDINGRYAITGRVPIHYFYRNLDQTQLTAHYRAADVALVTPLRDGMNLVAHEYVASRVQNDGVLVLSEFAGSSHYLKDALFVNPYDLDAVKQTLSRALSMSRKEMAERMRQLRRHVVKLDVHRWADRFLKTLESGV